MWGLYNSCPKWTAFIIAKMIFCFLIMVNVPVCWSSFPEIIFLMLKYNYHWHPWISKLAVLQEKKNNWKNEQNTSLLQVLETIYKICMYVHSSEIWDVIYYHVVCSSSVFHRSRISLLITFYSSLNTRPFACLPDSHTHAGFPHCLWKWPPQ